MGTNLVLTLTEHPTGKVLARRTWEDAAKYVTLNPVQGYIELRLPQRAGLNIKPGGNQ